MSDCETLPDELLSSELSSLQVSTSSTASSIIVDTIDDNEAPIIDAENEEKRKENIYIGDKLKQSLFSTSITNSTISTTNENPTTTTPHIIITEKTNESVAETKKVITNHKKKNNNIHKPKQILTCVAIAAASAVSSLSSSSSSFCPITTVSAASPINHNSNHHHRIVSSNNNKDTVTSSTAKNKVTSSLFSETHYVISSSLEEKEEERRQLNKVLSINRGGGEGEDKEKKKKNGGSSSSPTKTVPNHHHNKNNAAKDKDEKNNDIIQLILTEGNYYKVLGLTKSSSISKKQITKAYRKRCVQTHPDKISSSCTKDARKAFDKVSEAYNVLKDDSQRSIYDKYGLNGLKQQKQFGGAGGGAGGLQEEILKSFFGSTDPGGFGSFFSSSAQQQFFGREQEQHLRNKNQKYTLDVKLEDLYNGRTYPIAFRQQSHTDTKTLDVTIERGMMSGQSIKLPGVVDTIPDATPGDMIFKIQQKQQHSVFMNRKGYDLAMELTITLKEAICGFTKSIAHLDGRTVTFCGPSIEGEKIPMIIKTGDIHVLKGEGMPKRNDVGKEEDGYDYDDITERCMNYGDLYVQYKVDTPLSTAKAKGKERIEENLSFEERKQLGLLLDKLQQHGEQSDVEEQANEKIGIKQKRLLLPASASDFGQASGKFNANNNNDYDDIGEEHLQHDEDDGIDDMFGGGFFGNGARSRQGSGGMYEFFSTRSNGGKSGKRKTSQFFGSSASSPFFGSESNSGDDGDVQCQQM